MHNSNNSALSKDTIFGAKNHVNINYVFSSTSNLEDISVAKAKQALSKKLVALKETIQLSDKPINTAQTNNITETPSFHEAKAESVELSASAKESFARIGERAREAFIDDQIERAMAYNIPYESYGDDYYRLMQDIDQYEFLLEKADELNINWDDSEYDPIALEQLIEEREEEARNERNQLHCDYYSSVRVAV